MPDNIYKSKGFNDRADYLNQLSEEYCVSIYEVKAVADLLGETEDFDGLVSMLQDFRL